MRSTEKHVGARPLPKGLGSPRTSETKKLQHGSSSSTALAGQQQAAKPLDLGPLEAFLAQDFDVTAFTRNAIMSAEGSDATLRSLKSHLETVEHAISTHVSTHEDSLLGTLEAVGSLKREMIKGKSDSGALLESLRRVENDFKEPYERLKATARSLKSAHEATGILRKLEWFLVARKKLRATLDEQKQSGNSGLGKDASKAAQLVAELEELLNEGGLKGVSIVDAESRWIKEVGVKVRQDAQKALEKAIISLNQGEMGLALQAFFHLNSLEDRVSYATIWAAKEFAQEAREALRDANLGSNSDPSQKLQALRSRTDAMLERSLRTWAVRVWNLQRVLTKKRDPKTHVLFADVVKIEVFDQFWGRATSALEQELKACSRWVREAMVEDYARLRKSARAMLGRLWTSTSIVTGANVASSRKLAVGGPKETQALMQAFHPFLSEFLGKSLARLNQPVQVMFPEEETRGLRHVEPRPKAIPTSNDIQTFSQIIMKELSAVKGDLELTTAVAKPCAMAVSLFYEKSQALVSKADAAHSFRLIAPELAFSTSSASAMPVASTARTAIQEHNVNILLLVSLLSTKLKETIEMLNASTKTGEHAASFGEDLSAAAHDLDLGDENENDAEQRILGLDEDENDGAIDAPARSPPPQPSSSTAHSTSAFSRLEAARNQLDQLITEILQEYIGGEHCFKALDDLLQDINMENYNVNQEVTNPRSYCVKFAKACKTLREEHLAKLPQSDPVCVETCEKLVLRVISRIELRAAMVRPLSKAGRRMLIKDIQSLFDSLRSVYLGVKIGSSVEESMRIELSAMEKMLGQVQTIPQLLSQNLISKTIAWHHLFASAPSDVHSPHMKAGKPISTYLSDIEYASPDRVWSYVVSCLEGKSESVKQPFLEVQRT